MNYTRSDVLYVYHCQTCNHRADVLLPDDSHEGDMMECYVCSEPVSIEWDGGVTLPYASLRYAAYGLDSPYKCHSLRR